MIDTVAKRRTTLNGKTYQKGDTVQMPLQQFNDLEPTGRFERAPKPKAKDAKKPEMTVSEYVDGYMAKRWGENPPRPIVEFAANNAAAIEKEFQRRAKSAD